MPTSKYIGVRRERGKWRSEIRVNGVKKFLGYHDSEIAAAAAYNTAVDFYKLTRPKNLLNSPFTLHQAVQNIVDECVKSNTSFSIIQMVGKIIQAIASKNYILTDRPVTVNPHGYNVQTVKHQEVADIVESMFKAGKIPGFVVVKYKLNTVYLSDQDQRNRKK